MSEFLQKADSPQKEFWYPVQFEVLSQRVGGHPKEGLWSPVYQPYDLGRQAPPGQVTYFDQLCQPVTRLEEASFVLHPAELPPPPEFAPVSGAVDLNQQAWERAAVTYSAGGNWYNPGVMLAAPPLPSAGSLPSSEADEAPELIRTESGYSIRLTQSGKVVQATNFLLDVVSVVHIVGQPEKEAVRSVRLRVTIFAAGKNVRDLEIPYGSIDASVKLIQQKFGEAVVYPSTRKTVLDRIGPELRKQLAVCPQQFVYTCCGWTRTPKGMLVYVRDGVQPPEPNMEYRCGFHFGALPYGVSTQQLAVNAWKLLGLSSKVEAGLIPILFAHLGVLWSLFDEAGYPPHLILFVKGMTGSLKTAVTSLIFNFSGEKAANIPASFRDTSASMEVKMGQYKDQVLLVDDFCPAASEGSKRVLDQNLEQLVRFYGDGIAKARTNPRLEEVYEKRPHGLCAITGEDTSGSYSSRLRCLFLNVEPDTYDKALLAEYQKQPELWTDYMNSFVEFCENRAEGIVHFIEQRYSVLRDMGGQSIGERRLVDAYVSLRLTLEVMFQFIKDQLRLGEEEHQKHLESFSNVILNVCRKSAEASKAADPVKVFVRFLHEGISKGDILLATKQEFAAATDKFYGYRDASYYFFWPSMLFEYVRREYERGGRHFPLSMSQLWEALYVEKLLIPDHSRDEAGRKFEYGVRIGFAGRPRMLRIDPANFEKYL